VSNLKPIESAYWRAYQRSLPTGKEDKQYLITASCAGTPEITDSLLALYLAGKKSAGSSVMEDFLAAGDALPAVGNYWILLDSRGQPGCILKTEKVLTYRFSEVPEAIAIAEGEGDLSLGYWREVHGALWRPYLASWNLSRLEEATVITEFFSLVYGG
jgi:uncharacterized protein YhfF